MSSVDEQTSAPASTTPTGFVTSPVPFFARGMVQPSPTNEQVVSPLSPLSLSPGNSGPVRHPLSMHDRRAMDILDTSYGDEEETSGARADQLHPQNSGSGSYGVYVSPLDHSLKRSRERNEGSVNHPVPYGQDVVVPVHVPQQIVRRQDRRYVIPLPVEMY